MLVSLAEAKHVVHFLNKGRAVASYKDPIAVQQAFAVLYHKYGASADTIAEEISGYFHRDPKMQMALARAYYGNNEHVKTRRYIARALQRDPKCFQAYILEGDIFGVGNVDSAIVYYNKAIDVAPKEPDAYIRYANVMASRDIYLAKSRLEDLRKARPDYPVDIEIAGLYSNANDDASAVKAWSKTNPNTLSQNQLAQYCQNLYWSKQHDDALTMEVASVGISRFPQNYGFSRLYCWAATRAGEYKDALEKGKVWFDHTSNDSINSIDLYCLGTDYIGVGDIDKGYNYYAQIASKTDIFASQMDNQIKLTMGHLLDAKKKAKDYDGAIAMYSKFMEAYPSKTDHAYQLWTLSELYREKATGESGDEYTQTVGKMLSLYTRIEEKYPEWDNIRFVYYYHAVYTAQIKDPDGTQYLALPYYQKLYECLARKTELTSGEENMAATAASYIAFYYFKFRNDNKSAKVWFQKVLKYDPENETAKKALTFIR